MKYNVMFFNKNKQVALLETSECYIVANGFKGKDKAWANGNYYTFFDNDKCNALTKALDFYNLKVNDIYIGYDRLSEKIIFDGGGNGWNEEWCKEHQFDLL